MNLKGPQSKGITAFRDYGGTALLVPIQHSGRGATALDAVRVQRAIGDRAAVGRGAASSGLAFDAVDG